MGWAVPCQYKGNLFWMNSKGALSGLERIEMQISATGALFVCIEYSIHKPNMPVIIMFSMSVGVAGKGGHKSNPIVALAKPAASCFFRVLLLVLSKRPHHEHRTYVCQSCPEPQLESLGTP